MALSCLWKLLDPILNQSVNHRYIDCFHGNLAQVIKIWKPFIISLLSTWFEFQIVKRLPLFRQGFEEEHVLIIHIQMNITASLPARKEQPSSFATSSTDQNNLSKTKFCSRMVFPPMNQGNDRFFPRFLVSVVCSLPSFLAVLAHEALEETGSILVTPPSPWLP